MTNPNHSIRANSEKSAFPVFPAPRVWGLGWQGDAGAGLPHSDSTLDFDENGADIKDRITIIRNPLPPPSSHPVER